MYFVLEQRVKENHWRQIGIVIADSVQGAADKLGLVIFDISPIGIWAMLENDYFLTEFGEVTSLPVTPKE